MSRKISLFAFLSVFFASLSLLIYSCNDMPVQNSANKSTSLDTEKRDATAQIWVYVQVIQNIHGRSYIILDDQAFFSDWGSTPILTFTTLNQNTQSFDVYYKIHWIDSYGDNYFGWWDIFTSPQQFYRTIFTYPPSGDHFIEHWEYNVSNFVTNHTYEYQMGYDFIWNNDKPLINKK